VKGIYCLLIEVREDVSVKVGALGEIHLKKGCYGYFGSAQNNLEKRVARHFSQNKKVRWHIDYLLADKASVPVRVYAKKSGREEECRVAKKIGKTQVPVKGFGCSDCKCASHLFRLDSTNLIQAEGLRELSLLSIINGKGLK